MTTPILWSIAGTDSGGGGWSLPTVAQLQSLYEYLRIQGIRIQEPDLITGRAYDLPVL